MLVRTPVAETPRRSGRDSGHLRRRLLASLTAAGVVGAALIGAPAFADETEPDGTATTTVDTAQVDLDQIAPEEDAVEEGAVTTSDPAAAEGVSAADDTAAADASASPSQEPASEVPGAPAADESEPAEGEAEAAVDATGAQPGDEAGSADGISSHQQTSEVAETDVAAIAAAPWVQVTHGLSEWDMKYYGVRIWGMGFPAETEIIVTFDGEQVATIVVDPAAEDNSFGSLDETLFTYPASAGEHEIVLSGAGIVHTETIEVEADATYWSPAGYPLTAELTDGRSTVVTQSELLAAPMEIRALDFPTNQTVEVFVDGVFQAAVEHSTGDIFGSHEYLVTGPLDVGTVLVEFVHPVGIASVEFHVVPDDRGDLPAAGDYVGVFQQTAIAGGRVDPMEARPFGLEINDAGDLVALFGTYLWTCYNYDGTESEAYSQSFSAAPIPVTAITVDQPFDIHWTDSDDGRYVFQGIVLSDGSAGGTITAAPIDQSACVSKFEWYAEFDGSGGGPGDGEPGDGEPGDGEPGDGEPGDEEPGDNDGTGGTPGAGGSDDTRDPITAPDPVGGDDAGSHDGTLPRTGAESAGGAGIALALLTALAGAALLLRRRFQG